MDRSAPGAADAGTVARALRLLSCFGEREEWTLTQLCQRLTLPPSTTHRLLRLCIKEGFATSERKGVYGPGMALHRLAGSLAHRLPLPRLAAPLLRRFTDAFEETALLTLLDRPALTMFFAARAEPSVPIRYVLEMHMPGPLAWGATGKCLLAYLRPDETETVIDRADPAPSTGLLFDPKRLRAELAEIRRRGFALSRGERAPEGVAIAVPVFEAGGEIVANLAVTIPIFRYKKANGERFLALLRTLAVELSETLGAPRKG